MNAFQHWKAEEYNRKQYHSDQKVAQVLHQKEHDLQKKREARELGAEQKAQQR